MRSLFRVSIIKGSHCCIYIAGAHVTHYREKENSSVYFECRTGLQGVAKEIVKLNLTFTRNDSRKCSAICGEEQQLECNEATLVGVKMLVSAD